MLPCSAVVGGGCEGGGGGVWGNNIIGPDRNKSASEVQLQQKK